MNKSIKDLVLLGIELQLERYFLDARWESYKEQKRLTEEYADKIFNIVYKEEEDDMFDTCTEFGYQKKSIVKPSFESIKQAVEVELDRELTEHEIEALHVFVEYKPKLTVSQYAEYFEGKDDGDMRVGEE